MRRQERSVQEAGVAARRHGMIARQAMVETQSVKELGEGASDGATAVEMVDEGGGGGEGGGAAVGGGCVIILEFGLFFG